MKTTAGSRPLRPDKIPALAAAPLDLLVIGGGIVGASIARDAARRGLRVGLVEQADFAFGTSSRSSRLLHGGLRYLSQGRVGLVREASIEKRRLHEIAPHLAEPLAFIFPTYRGSGWPLWQLRIGVRVYDLLCNNRNLGRSGALDRDALIARVPGLRTEKLAGGVRYFDALTNDARLVLDTLRSAEVAGALLASYTKFVRAESTGGDWRVEVQDTGVPTAAASPLVARAIVNATGPWSDRVPRSAVRLRLTKGIHLVLDRARLPVPDAVVLTEGRRLLFVIPWGERVILGTTDTDYDGDPAAPTCDTTDVDYLLANANDAFPLAHLRREDVIRSWVGLRPLVADQQGNPSDISRSHEIHQSEPRWWDVVGGKLTTCRLMAEQTVDAVVRELGFSALSPDTASVPLLPAGAPPTGGVLPPPVTEDVVRHCCRHEWATHLDDVMIRRTSWHYYHRDAGPIARRVLEWMARECDWDDARAACEWRRYVDATDPQFPLTP
ncbi:MAG: glycerol-3-phosphate dehydrogenase/oxidase [Lacunisphaera sp.]|nr:glycerol-3-phosphate dehydrogenase/oxidase [Lacunisphaera sp.]